jgi:hypothetical protein
MKFSDDPQSKIVFQDSSSVLHLDSCVLSFQGVGHQLSQGILRISNKVGLVTQTEFDEPALTLDDSLGVHITPKSSLVLKGPLRYKKALEKLLSPA